MLKNLYFLSRPILIGFVAGLLMFFGGIALSKILPGNVEKDPFMYMIAGFVMFLGTLYFRFIPLLKYFQSVVRKSGGMMKVLCLEHTEFVKRLTEEKSVQERKNEN